MRVIKEITETATHDGTPFGKAKAKGFLQSRIEQRRNNLEIVHQCRVLVESTAFEEKEATLECRCVYTSPSVAPGDDTCASPSA